MNTCSPLYIHLNLVMIVAVMTRPVVVCIIPGRWRGRAITRGVIAAAHYNAGCANMHSGPPAAARAPSVIALGRHCGADTCGN